MTSVVYPPATGEMDDRRRKLAPAIHEVFDAFSQQVFDAFSQQVFADGALPARTKQLVAVAAAHVTQCPYCIGGHTRPAPGWRERSGDHGGHLGRGRDAGGRRVRALHSGPARPRR